MKQPNHCQIAVIGAGIAGAACCLRLAQAGIEPVWIGKSTDRRDKPGELLSAAARPVLTALGLEDLLQSEKHRASHTLYSAWGSRQLAERSSIVHLEGPQVVLDRPAFEKDLVQRVTQAGIHPAGEDLLQADQVENGWELTLNTRTVSCSFAIDASGRKAVLAGKQTTRFRADKLAALYAFLEQDPSSEISPSQATIIEAVPSGWFYTTLLPDGRLAFSYYSDADLMPSRRRETGPWPCLLAEATYVRRWIEEAGYKLPLENNTASAATSWLAPCAAKTWLAVGDTAAAFDPLSSHGMTSALWSGLRGADAAIAAVNGDISGVRNYSTNVARGVQEFLTTRSRIYAMEPRFKDNPFWQRRQQFVSEATETA